MLPKEAIDDLAGVMTPKFLATANADGIPNIVPVITTMAADAETIIFGELMVRKTKRNLGENPKISVLVITEALDLWIIRGDFVEFQKTGPYVDMINENPMYRYNAYVGINRVAVIRVKDVVLHAKLSKLGVAAQFLKVKAVSSFAKSEDGEVMPVQVVEKFGRAKSVRVLSAIDADGYPDAILTMSMTPADSSTLVFAPGLFKDRLSSLRIGAPVAAGVITFDPISYQVKGIWQGIRSYLGVKLGIMKVTEVYTAGPPRPGARIV